MSASTAPTWDTLVNNVREAYNASITKADDAILAGEEQIPAPAKSEAAGAKTKSLSPEQVNKITVWVIKKGLGVITQGMVPSGQVDAGIDFLVSISGMPMPQGPEAVIIKKLDGIKDDIASLKQDVNDAKRLTELVGSLDAIRNVNSTVSNIWHEIITGLELQDQQTTFSAIAKIEQQYVSKLLNDLHTAFTEGIFTMTAPLAPNLYNYYRAKLVNTDPEAKFDILAFEGNLRRWERDYLKVSRMAMGLLLLKEQCRGPEEAESAVKQQVRIKKENETKKTEVLKALWGNMGPSPASNNSYQTLYQLASANFEAEAAKLWHVKFINGSKLGLGEDAIVQFQRRSNGKWTLRSAEEYRSNRRDVNLAPEFLHMSQLVWASTSKGLKTVEVESWDSVDIGRPACEFKIIPQDPSPAQSPDRIFKLVCMKSDRDGKGIAWESDILIREANLAYPISPQTSSAPGTDNKALITSPLSAWKDKVDFFQSHNSRLMTCTILNRSRYVAVLTEVATGSGRVAQYANTVWLPHEEMPVGACGVARRNECAAGHDTVSSTFKFALYEVDNLGTTTDEQRKRVAELWQLDSRTCRPILRTSGEKGGVKLVCHVLICPTACATSSAGNKICIAEQNASNTTTQIPAPSEMWKNGTRGMEPGSFYFPVTQASMLISEGWQADAKVVLYGDDELRKFQVKRAEEAFRLVYGMYSR